MKSTMTPDQEKQSRTIPPANLPRIALPRPEQPAQPAAAAPVHQDMPAISVDHLNVYFGSNHVLKNVSLDIRPRAVTAIIGPSGCGKSTFLRALNRMHELIPEARMDGTIRLFGQEIYAPDVEPVIVRRRVGMVFQKSNPFPTMSIADNVTVGLRLNGIRKQGVLAERMEQSLRMAALWDEVKDRLRAPAISLSGGQQQRLCIARALAVQPEVLLMDEPASALDPLATSKIESLILELKKDYTIIIVTHNMQQAARVSEDTAFFYIGELVEIGPTAKIFTTPSQKRTEDYVTGRFG
jgi:phosphate transport system ATP-binding protein